MTRQALLDLAALEELLWLTNQLKEMDCALAAGDLAEVASRALAQEIEHDA